MVELFYRNDDIDEGKRVIQMLKDKGFNENHILYYSSFNASQANLVLQVSVIHIHIYDYMYMHMYT